MKTYSPFSKEFKRFKIAMFKSTAVYITATPKVSEKRNTPVFVISKFKEPIPSVVDYIVDLHLGAPDEMLYVKPIGGNTLTVLGGDTVDLALCEKDRVGFYTRMRDDLRAQYGICYIPDNHDLIPEVHYLVIGKTLFSGGSFEADPERYLKYRFKQPGAGFLKRKLWSPMVKFVAENFDRDLKMDFLDRAAAVAKEHGCTKYVCGHFHPREKIQAVHKGVLIEVMPRGQHKVVID